MHLITQVRTKTTLIKIYSSNKDFVLEVEPAVFKDMNDQQICDLVFNHLGGEQVDIIDGARNNAARSYAIF